MTSHHLYYSKSSYLLSVCFTVSLKCHCTSYVWYVQNQILLSWCAYQELLLLLTFQPHFNLSLNPSHAFLGPHLWVISHWALLNGTSFTLISLISHLYHTYLYPYSSSQLLNNTALLFCKGGLIASNVSYLKSQLSLVPLQSMEMARNFRVIHPMQREMSERGRMNICKLILRQDESPSTSVSFFLLLVEAAL